MLDQAHVAYEEQHWRARITTDVRRRRGRVLDNGQESLFGVNEYELLRLLGRGEFGEVFLAERSTGVGPSRKFAVKVLDKPALRSVRRYSSSETMGMQVQTELDRVRHEILVQETLFYRHTTLLFEIMDTEAMRERGAPRQDGPQMHGALSEFIDHDHLYLVLELLQEGEVMEDVPDPTAPVGQQRRFIYPPNGGTIPEPLAARYTVHLFLALAYLHRRGIVHRDIKPQNIFRNERDHCVLGDFGCARDLGTELGLAGTDQGNPADIRSREHHRLRDSAGTMAFWAPETITGQEFDPYAADVWAAGVTVWCFLFGKPPFHGRSEAHLLEAIHSAPLEVPEDPARLFSSLDASTDGIALPPAMPPIWVGSNRAVFPGVGGETDADLPPPMPSAVVGYDAAGAGGISPWAPDQPASGGGAAAAAAGGGGRRKREVTTDDVGPGAHREPTARDFLQFVLERESARRPVALEALKHPWLAEAFREYEMEDAAIREEKRARKAAVTGV